ncbi:MAG: hypothetical protein MI744_10060 [Pseudomonadales bacterium]|nr:hypothetical protein [Pseudomonadales bacterium]
MPIKLEENHVHKRVIIFAMNDKALTDGILREVKVCAQEATFDLIRTHIVQGRNFRRYEFTEIRKGVNIVDYHLLGRNEQMLSMTSDERFRLELAVTKETDDSQLFVVHDQLIQPNS